VLAGPKGVLCKSFEKQVLHHICLAFKGVFAKSLQPYLQSCLSRPSAAVDSRGCCGRRCTVCNRAAAQGLLVARLKAGRCGTSPWGSRQLGSTSLSAGVLRPGCAQLPDTRWERGGGATCGEAGGVTGDPPSLAVASARGR
jgi:hypothetical protein